MRFKLKIGKYFLIFQLILGFFLLISSYLDLLTVFLRAKDRNRPLAGVKDLD